MHNNIAKVLLSEEEIQKRVKELGRQIHEDYKDKDKIVMIGLLKGAIYFFTDLSLAIDSFRWRLICRCALILWWRLLTATARKPAAAWM